MSKLADYSSYIMTMDDPAWISYFNSSAKRDITNSNKKIANLILESSEKDEEVDDIVTEDEFELEITKEAENIELEARRDEFEEFAMLKASIDNACEQIEKRLKEREQEKSKLVNELEASRDENESCWLQIEELEANVEETNDILGNVIQEKSNLVEALRVENESYKMQIEDLEAKYTEEKCKLVSDLEASRDENERYKMQIKGLEAKYEEVNDYFEIGIEEKCKLFHELEASREEVEKYNKALENLNSSFRDVSMDAFDAKEALYLTLLENESYKKLNDEHVMNMEESNEALEKLKLAYEEVTLEAKEAKRALFLTRLDIKNNQFEIDRLKFFMNEEKTKYEKQIEDLMAKNELEAREASDNYEKQIEYLISINEKNVLEAREASDDYKKQIEDLMAKNEKNESTLNDWIFGDWKLVEEQEQQQLDHN
ncbi:hypothetical protein CASFOL_023801 [Castilleja foliolosa]|uniref:Uncharacterized protein n=1 Tax=Castilleja foliolosa TaxID=1961234 RepID=A0ABD3CMX4_9LAMI